MYLDWLAMPASALPMPRGLASDDDELPESRLLIQQQGNAVTIHDGFLQVRYGLSAA